MNDAIDDSLKQGMKVVMDAEGNQSRILSYLLGKLRDKSNHHLAHQIHMGKVQSYLTSVTLQWVRERVGFAADLPVFRKSGKASVRAPGDYSGRVPGDADTMERIRQRQPDWRLRLPMSAYLAVREHHKFPPLLLVGYQHWIYEDRDPRWGVDGRAMNDSLTLRGLEPGGIYWDLDDSETQFYAFDGQHRLMAIRGLHDLIQNGKLHDLDENGNPRRGGELSQDDVIEYIRMRGGTDNDRADIHERIQRLMSERIGVEIIPAVCRGETYDKALRRLGQTLADVNENARPSAKSRDIRLDETDGFRIIARRLCQEHVLLKSSVRNGKKRPRVDENKTNLPEKSDCYTTLKALAETVERYLTANGSLPEGARYASWDNAIARGTRARPEDRELDQGMRAMIAYFDHLEKIPSHIDFVQGKQASKIRQSEGGDDNVLFRPMVQTALAEALGKLAAQGVSLENAVEEIGRQEERGQLKLAERTAPWFGVVCDATGKMRRHKKYGDLCSRLFRYLLGGGLEDGLERERLRADFARARRLDTGKEMAVSLEGEEVGLEAIRLPDPWR